MVDNASTDDTTEAVTSAAAQSPWPIRLVREPQLGLSPSRNRALAESQAPIALFTDDDVEVCAGWADAMFARFADESVGAVGGRIFPNWEHPPPEWLQGWWLDLLALHDYGNSPIELSPAQPPIGANMAVRRDLLPTPAFSLRLGYRGAATVGSAEFRLMDVVAREKRLVYEPSAAVRHFVPANRMTRSAMRRASLHNGMGSSRRDAMRGMGVSRLRAVRHVPGEWRLARRIKSINDRAAVFTADAADAEFDAFTRLGKILDAALGSKPGRIADWVTSLQV